MDEKHHCKINKKGFALATAIVIGGIYIICAIFVALWPDFSMKLLGWLIHLVNIGDVVLTFGNFLVGLIQAVVYTYIGAWLVAWLHNKFCK